MKNDRSIRTAAKATGLIAALITVTAAPDADAQVLRVLVADHWLHRHGDPRSPAAEPVRRQMRLAFCCEEAGWQQQVLARSMDLHAAALRGMAEGSRQPAPGGRQ